MTHDHDAPPRPSPAADRPVATPVARERAPRAAATDAAGAVDAMGDDDEGHRRHGLDPVFGVRSADIEPYTGLRYLSKLFRLIAIMLVLLLVAEVATGLAQQGTEAIPTLVAEASRLIVFAALLWGVGDLVLLLIDTGHDVRAARVLLGRQVAHLVRLGPNAPTPSSHAATTASDPANAAGAAPRAAPAREAR
jgi:hypothetical protein